MEKVAYISGKITGVKNGNIAKFNAAEKLLKQKGYRVLNPHKVCSDIHPSASWATFMKRNLVALIGCDCVFLLDDWHESKGAQVEVELASNLGISVLEIETMEPVTINFRSFGVYKGALLNIRL